MSVICLFSLINLLSTVFILHFKDKYDLELKHYIWMFDCLNVLIQTIFVIAILLALIILNYIVMQSI
jgi:hypothetical protein